MKLVKVVTHHKNPDRAAELFAQEGVVAVGWSTLGNLSNLTREDIKRKSQKLSGRTTQESAKDASQLIIFRDEVQKGDIVIAYKGNNVVALIGEIIGPYKFITKNRVGDLKGEIGYPNQRKVKWRDNPRNFDRSFLSRDISEWVARPGTISVHEFHEYDNSNLDKIMLGIPSADTIAKALEIESEDEIKDFIEKHPESLEEGLVIVKREYQTSSGFMDFLAKDKNGTDTIIEVKKKARDTTVMQIRRYMRAYIKEKESAIRGVIVAEEITRDCLEEIADLVPRGFNFKLYKCSKTFHFEQTSIQ